MTELLEIAVSEIATGEDRARDLDPAWAAGLAAIIAEQGLQSPIRVRRVDDGYRLVAGLHRLEAHRILGRETIAALLSGAATDDDARLEEVMENLGRYDLIALDRCHHLATLKDLWERKYPHTKRGGDPAAKAKLQSLQSGPDGQAVFGFARDNADKIGLSWRSIMQAVKIWHGLVPSVRGRLRGSDLATKQTELKALSELPANRQIKALDLILDPELRGIKNVAQALEYLTEGVVRDGHEQFFARMRKTFAAMDDETFDAVILADEERIIASLQRQGRI